MKQQKVNGEILKVKIQDNLYNTYFDAEVPISNKKRIKELGEDLRNKGVNL